MVVGEHLASIKREAGGSTGSDSEIIAELLGRNTRGGPLEELQNPEHDYCGSRERRSWAQDNLILSSSDPCSPWKALSGAFPVFRRRVVD